MASEERTGATPQQGSRLPAPNGSTDVKGLKRRGQRLKKAEISLPLTAETGGGLWVNYVEVKKKRQVR